MDNFTVRPVPLNKMGKPTYRESAPLGDTDAMKLSYRMQRGDVSMEFGLDGKWESHDHPVADPTNAQFYIDNFVDVSRDRFGGFANVTWDGPQWDVETGIRYNQVKMNAGEVSGDLAIPPMSPMYVQQERLDKLAAEAGPERLHRMVEAFETTVRYEIAFWEMAMTGEDWDRVLTTNLDGFYNALHPLVMPMVRARRGGRVVVMSSLAGTRGNRGQVNYAASKAGVVNLTKNIAQEFGEKGIRCNAICPGFFPAELTALYTEQWRRRAEAELDYRMPLAVGVAWLLARGRFPGKGLLNAVVHLPLVMPSKKSREARQTAVFDERERRFISLSG